MFCLNLRRDLDPDPRGLETDDLHEVGHVLPVRMVIALAFFKRIFTRSLPMNQPHGLIIGDVYGTCGVSTNTHVPGAGGKHSANDTHRRRGCERKQPPQPLATTRTRTCVWSSPV